MISASERGRPAVEAIDDALIRRFGHVVEANAVKQRIDRLVRPVMEARGFVPVRRRCPAKSALFTSGTVNGSNRPIMAVLGKHGLEFDADDVSREIQSAIEMVGGNRPFAERFIGFAWKDRSDIALATPEGPLAILGNAIDQALTEAASKRDVAVPDIQLTVAERSFVRRQGSAAGSTGAAIDRPAKTAFKPGALCATALTPPQAARLLDRDCDRIEEWVRQRRLHGLLLGNGTVGRIPLFQFDDGARFEARGHVGGRNPGLSLAGGPPSAAGAPRPVCSAPRGLQRGFDAIHSLRRGRLGEVCRGGVSRPTSDWHPRRRSVARRVHFRAQSPPPRSLRAVADPRGRLCGDWLWRPRNCTRMVEGHVRCVLRHRRPPIRLGDACRKHGLCVLRRCQPTVSATPVFHVPLATTSSDL